MTIITKQVETSWNPTTKNYYIEKGYIFTKYGDKFIVYTKDLQPRSNVIIEFKCDYCGNLIKRKFGRYNEMKNESFSKKDSCYKCNGLKIRDENRIKQELGLLKLGDKGYWEFKENRVKELERYINNNGTVEKINKDKIGNPLYCAIMEYDKVSLREFVENELNIDWSTVSSYDVNNQFREFDNIRKVIIDFINEIGHFPTYNDFKYIIGLNQRFVEHFGGIYELKRMLKWNDREDYLDDNGFYNRSSFEYMVAQFLIHNGITYKREQHPFKETNHASDFTIFLKNGTVYHVEVWGYDVTNNGFYSKKYYKIKSQKIRLYNKYKLNLISIEREVFDNSYDRIQDILIDKFSPILNNELKRIDLEFMISPKSLSDKEIISILLKNSNLKDSLATNKYYQSIGLNSYLIEIRKRYGSIHKFATTYQLKTRRKIYEWNKDIIFNIFKKISDNGERINKQTIYKYNYGGLYSYLRKSGSNLVDLKLEFYFKFIDDISFISKGDLRTIKTVSENNVDYLNVKVTDEQIKIAKIILGKLNNNLLISV